MLQVSRRHQPATCQTSLLPQRIIIVSVWVLFPDNGGTASHPLGFTHGHLQTSSHVVEVIQTFLARQAMVPDSCLRCGRGVSEECLTVVVGLARQTRCTVILIVVPILNLSPDQHCISRCYVQYLFLRECFDTVGGSDGFGGKVFELVPFDAGLDAHIIAYVTGAAPLINSLLDRIEHLARAKGDLFNFLLDEVAENGNGFSVLAIDCELAAAGVLVQGDQWPPVRLRHDI